MLAWIARLIARGGYWSIAALMAIENVVLPIPSELIMPLAGYDTTKGHLSLLMVIVAGTVGSVLGALPLYLPARWFGQKRVAAWVGRHGKWFFVSKRDIENAQKRFEHRGGFVAVAIAQILPGVRGIISLPAGFARMSVVAFLTANFLGTLIWCTALAIAGKLLGSSFMKVDQWLGPTGWIVLAVLVVGGLGWLRLRTSRRR